MYLFESEMLRDPEYWKAVQIDDHYGTQVKMLIRTRGLVKSNWCVIDNNYNYYRSLSFVGSYQLCVVTDTVCHLNHEQYLLANSVSHPLGWNSDFIWNLVSCITMRPNCEHIKLICHQTKYSCGFTWWSSLKHKKFWFE